MFPLSVVIGIIVAALALTSLSALALLGLLLRDYRNKSLW